MKKKLVMIMILGIGIVILGCSSVNKSINPSNLPTQEYKSEGEITPSNEIKEDANAPKSPDEDPTLLEESTDNLTPIEITEEDATAPTDGNYIEVEAPPFATGEVAK